MDETTVERDSGVDGERAANSDRPLGESNEEAGGIGEQDAILRAIVDGSAAADSIRAAEEAARPKRTSPPDIVGGDGDGKSKRGRKAKAPEPEKVSVAKCGSVVSFAFGGVSLGLTGTLALGLKPEEKREIGAALAEAFESAPDNPLVTRVMRGAPWLNLVMTAGWAIMERIDAVRKYQAAQAKKAAPIVRPPTTANNVHDIIAPEPQAL